MPIALYPGTFDPFTLGHVDVLRRGTTLFEKVVVAVGRRVDKSTLFDPDERVALVRESSRALGNVEVASFDGLVVDFARSVGARVLLRGLRNATDYEYEAQMAITNERLSPELETVFLVASVETAFISSTLIKEVLHAGGPVDRFVPGPVARALRAKLS